MARLCVRSRMRRPLAWGSASASVEIWASSSSHRAIPRRWKAELARSMDASASQPWAPGRLAVRLSVSTCAATSTGADAALARAPRRGVPEPDLELRELQETAPGLPAPEAVEHVVAPKSTSAALKAASAMAPATEATPAWPSARQKDRSSSKSGAPDVMSWAMACAPRSPKMLPGRARRCTVRASASALATALTPRSPTPVWRRCTSDRPAAREMPWASATAPSSPRLPPMTATRAMRGLRARS
mmetsp:Transcript_7683/g.22671  ORF Transcript_7683/g.22671 Transcript_7683/m.22671 type:complete len:245 (-) Transcript_7683:2364-3098(-)